MNFCNVLVEVPFESCPCMSFEMEVNQIKSDDWHVIEAYKCKHYNSCKEGIETYLKGHKDNGNN